MRKKIFTFLLALAASVGMMNAAVGGKLPGAFSVSSTKQVYFSQGNLQATTNNLGQTWTWGFAEHQWDYIGGRKYEDDPDPQTGNNFINGNGTVSENGTVDLFGWSTTATYYGIHYITSDASLYPNNFVDWGNAMGGDWYTLSSAEWTYLYSGRANAANLRGQAKVNGNNGYIFLPDDWTIPSGLEFNPNPGLYYFNTYSGADWTAMENAGAVFLPASGYRYGTEVGSIGNNGNYWSSTFVTSPYYPKAGRFCFNQNKGQADDDTSWSSYSVRLVSGTPPSSGPTYLDANFGINFCTNPYTKVGGGSLPDGVEVTGEFNDNQHGYYSPVITIPVTAGNYLVKMGTCRFSNQDGSVKNEEGSVTYTTLETNTGVCYDANPSKNYVADIITIPSDQIIKVYGAQYTPYFSIEKMPEIPAFTDFTINFMSDSYTVAEGTLPEGTVIDGTPNTGQTAHGYQNVVATVPVKAGKYRLTLGTCQYGTGTGNVMSETNIELASFDQKTTACYHHNPAENIISMIFDVDQDQHITIDCGNYTPYMKLEAVTSYAVEFALGDAEGTAPAAVDVAVGEDITMPVNKTMYKEGYTLTGWSDGADTYAIGTAFTPASDVTLTPVFTQNAIAITEATEDVTVRWYFGKSNNAPDFAWQNNSGLLVAQVTVGDNPMDVCLAVNATSGKFSNAGRTDKWAQVNNGTILSFPAKEDAVVVVESYNNNPEHYTINAVAGTLTCNTNDYYSYLEVTYPAPAPTPQPAEDVDITPNADPQHANVYYSTFFDSSVKYELPAGVEAYVADLSGANLLLTKIAEAGEVIPANVAVILKSTVTPFTLTVSDAEAVTFTATNDLQGSDTQIATPANCYVLAGTDGVVGFYHYTASQLNAHKAYVVYSGSNQAPRRMPFIFDQATGVESVQPSAISSQKVIENGQLFIIKNGVKYNAQGQNVK